MLTPVYQNKILHIQENYSPYYHHRDNLKYSKHKCPNFYLRYPGFKSYSCLEGLSFHLIFLTLSWKSSRYTKIH
jgi:hypothetical protein